MEGTLPSISLRESLIFVLLVTALCYAPVGRAHFVYDDRWMVVENPAIQRVTPLRFFTDPTTVATPSSGLDQDVYRPLTPLSFSVDFHFWSLNPRGYHLENLLWHLLNGILLYWIATVILGSSSGAVFAAAIFLLHPMQVQTVAWVTQRSGLLSTAFGFLMLLALLPEDISTRRLFLGWLCGLACFFSKESGIIFPLLLLLIRPRNFMFRRSIGLFVGDFGYFLLRWHALHQWSQLPDHSFFLRTDLALGLLAFPVYLGKMMVPIALRPSYDYPHWSLWRIAAAALFFAGYAGCMFVLSRRRQTRGIVLGWILLSLLPALQLIPIRAFFAERFAYGALAGFALGAGWGWDRFRRYRWLGIVWLMLVTWVTVQTVPHWQDSTSLWAYAVHQEPSNAFAHASYAETLQDPDQAIAQYQLALANHPSPDIRFDVTNNLAWRLLQKKQPGEALFWAIEATQLQSDSVAALYNLCTAALQVGELDRAQSAYQRLQHLPDTPPAMLQSLAIQLRSVGRAT